MTFSLLLRVEKEVDSPPLPTISDMQQERKTENSQNTIRSSEGAWGANSENMYLQCELNKSKDGPDTELAGT